MGLGFKPVTLDLDMRSGDGWRHQFTFHDAGDHDRDGIAEDPGNPTPLNLSGYTFSAQVRVNKNDQSTPLPIGIPVAIDINTAGAASGVLVLSLTPDQTTALLTAGEGKSSKVLFWDFQITNNSDPADKHTWYDGIVNMTLDVTRP
jgi:hypothetical protein